jgi:hypothetical protein
MLGSDAQAATEGVKVMCKNTLEVCLQGRGDVPDS